jgi:hypothetical protein
MLEEFQPGAKNCQDRRIGLARLNGTENRVVPE